MQSEAPQRNAGGDTSMRGGLPDLGDLLFGIAIVFGVLIGVFECVERRRESKREQRLLDAIEREYQAYCRAGRM